MRRFLDGELDAWQFRALKEPNGIWRERSGPIQTVGLALEGAPGLAAWIEDHQIDTLVVHRPWGLPEQLPGGPAVLAYHVAFDERLTIGWNPLLAEALGLERIEPLGEKQGRTIGMIGDVAACRLHEFGASLERTLQAPVALRGDPQRKIDRVAVVGAMWPRTVAEAAARGAGVYVTGTFRENAAAAVAKTGIAVAIAGHRPPELWGLRALGRAVGEAFPGLRVVVWDR